MGQGPVVPGRASWTGLLLFLILAGAAFGNAVGYVLYAGNPLVSSDAWYFIDVFLRKAMEGSATIQDYYVKRSVDDHAQPVLKLLMLANARWFGLDFVVEALFGILFAALTFAVLAYAAAISGVGPRSGWRHAVLLGVMGACLVTLNAGMVFNWSLVTLGYWPYLLASVSGVVTWRVLTEGKHWTLLVLVAFAVSFLLDNAGVLASLAVALAAGFYAFRHSARRRAALGVVLVFVASQVFYQSIGRTLLFSGVVLDPTTASDQSRLAMLWAMRADWWEMAVTVFGSTLAHIFTLQHYAGEHARIWQTALALAAAGMHAWFWLSAWRIRWNAAGFLAVTLMLLFYGTVAGIVLTRVPVNGPDYLHEPRYVLFYLLSNVSLLLMGLAISAGRAARSSMPPALILAGLLLVLQLPLSAFTWRDGRYLHKYYHTMARQTYALGRGVVPANCVALIAACVMPKQERDRAMKFLKEYRLNAFSPVFVARYRLQALATE